MKYTLKISALAAADLENIVSFIAADKPSRAVAFVDELVAKIETLSVMPKRCPLAEEGRLKRVELRHLIHGAYRILFMVHANQIIIVRVIHGARVIELGTMK